MKSILKVMALCAACLSAHAAFAGPAREVPLQNPSFEQGCDEQGVPVGWQSPSAARLAVVDHACDGRKALKIEAGGSVSQAAPAEGGLNYTLTVKARTPLFEDRDSFAFHSRAYLDLVFLPSGKKFRTEMVTPFGRGADFVEYAVGGPAPPGTKQVQVALVTGRSAMTADDVKLVAYEESYDHFQLKPLHIDTTVVRNGKPASKIVVPASGDYDDLARTIAGRIKQLTGVEVPTVRDTAFSVCKQQRLKENLIALGNRNTNKVVSDFYDLYYCIIDLRYPGRGGSVVRSLHDPFGDGHNVIFVGASDAEGMAQAVDDFLGALDDAKAGRGNLKVGYLAMIRLGSDVNIPDEISFNELKSIKPWDATNRTGGYGWTVITKCMAYYYLTGKESYAREFMRLAFPKDPQTVADLTSCGQDFRADRKEPLVDVYHYRAHLPVVYWDLIEESPFFTDKDRARITRQFMKQVRTFRATPDYGCEVDKTRYPPAIINSRHHQWAAMTFYTLGRYLSKYYPDYEWKAVKRSAEYFFAPLYLKKQVCNRGEAARLERYPTTLASLFAYTLMSGNKHPVELGSLRDQTRNLEILIDWKENDWVLRQAPTSIFNQMAYLFNNSRYVRARNLITVRGDIFRPGQSYWPDERALPFEPFGIDRWETLRPTRFEFYFWQLLWEEALEHQDKMFRLTSFRTSNDGSGDFLLFDGIHIGGVYHCFSLLEYVLNGDILFMGQRTHLNFMSSGMTAAKRPKYSLLDRLEINGRSAVIAASVPGYNFTHWRRCVLHRKGRYTLVTDRLTSLRDTPAATVELNWALADGTAADASPGLVKIKVVQSAGHDALFAFKALELPGDRLKSNLPPDNILRSTYDAVTLKNDDKGAYLEISFDVPKEVEGEMAADFVNSRNRGLVRMTLDGEVILPRFNQYSPQSRKVAATVSLGRRRLGAGRHVIRLESLGPASDSIGCFISFRGLKVFGKLRTNEYVLGISDKLKTAVRDVGTTIGSAASDKMISAVWTGALKEGEEKLFFSLITPKAAAGKAGNCVRLAPNAAALALGDGPAVAVSGEYGGTKADIAVLGSGHLVACGATRCGGFFSSSEPIDVDWDFATGDLAIKCARKSAATFALENARVDFRGRGAVTLERAGEDFKLLLEKGAYTLKNAKPRASLVATNRRQCLDAFAKASAERDRAPVVELNAVEVSAPELQIEWRAQVGGFPYDVEVFQSGGQTIVAVAEDTNIFLFDSKGKLIRKLTADSPAKVIHYWPEAKLLAGGCLDFKVIAFDIASGRRRWVFESKDINPHLKKSGFGGWFDRNPLENKGIHALASGVFLNGKSQLLVGTASTVEALDENGKLLQSMMAGPGVVTDMTLLNCGGEVKLLPARLFGRFMLYQLSSRDPQKFKCLSVGEFAPRRGASTYAAEYGNGYARIIAEDLDGDGKQEVVGLFNGALNGIHVWDNKGTIIGDAAFGDGRASPRPSYKKRLPELNMRGLGIADLDGDGKKELCVITSRGFLIALDWKCNKLWTKRMPSEPISLEVFDAGKDGKGIIVVGCRKGGAYSLDAKGVFTGRTNIGGIPLQIVRLARSEVVSATSKGDVVACRVVR